MSFIKKGGGGLSQLTSATDSNKLNHSQNDLSWKQSRTWKYSHNLQFSKINQPVEYLTKEYNHVLDSASLTWMWFGIVSSISVKTKETEILCRSARAANTEQ
jgi:hypothetical protein